jgi:hypothetical protein
MSLINYKALALVYTNYATANIAPIPAANVSYRDCRLNVVT